MPEKISSFDLLQRQKSDIDAVFRSHKDRLVKLGEIAVVLHADMEELGSFVERHTASVCPDCISVCCINRHSYHTMDDMVFIHALRAEFPRHSGGLDNSAPCHFLGKKGCVLERSLRPYRCNWYFCSPLLEHIAGHNSRRRYRFFISLLEKITDRRLTFMDEYASVSGNTVGVPVDKTG